jgi:hypothetical protein
MWDILRYMWTKEARGTFSEGKSSFTYVGDAAGPPDITLLGIMQ